MQKQRYTFWSNEAEEKEIIKNDFIKCEHTNQIEL